MLRKILVPLDGSEHSYKTLDFALDLAKGQHAKICIMHVTEEEKFREFLNDAEIKKFYKLDDINAAIATYPERASADIFRIAGDKAKSDKIEFETVAVTGDPAEEIVSYARDFDLVIIGSTGLGKTRFQLGSVAEKVARHALCSVTIVR